MKHVTISYPDEQFDWLEDHPEINKSGLFRAIVAYMMKNGKSYLDAGDLKEISKNFSD